MRLTPLYGTALAPAPLSITSRCMVHWWAPDLSTHAPRTGHVGLFTRGATGTFVDQRSVSMTAVHAEPRWERRDGRMGLLMTAADRLRFGSATGGLGVRAIAQAGLLEIMESGARTTANATLFYLGNDAISGARLYLDTSGTYYRITFHNGTTSVTATLTAGQPMPGDTVLLRWQLYDDRSVQLWQSINGAAETATNRTSGIAAPSASAFGATTYARLNSRGSASNGGAGWYRLLKLMSGLPDYTTLLTQR
jgi:hypothetical protein